MPRKRFRLDSSDKAPNPTPVQSSPIIRVLQRLERLRSRSIITATIS